MYTTSQAYKDLIFSDGRNTRITGTITLKDGKVIQLNNDVIAKKPEINNQCSGDNDLILGQAYQGQLKMSIFSKTDRYTMYDAKIKIAFEIETDTELGTFEKIPLGVYVISECIRSSNDILQITAFDEIDKLDKSYGGESIAGTASDILSAVAKLTKVNLAQSVSEIARLPNASVLLGIDTNAKVNTYRDVVGDLSAVLGGFCYMDREGKLAVRAFSNTPVKTIGVDYRNKNKISDYKVKYSKVSCIKDGKKISVGSGTNQELELGENAFLQMASEASVKEVLNTLLNLYKNISWTPASFDFTGDPSIDLGDMVEITGYSAKSSTLVPLHKTTWKWRGSHSVTAVGKNPYLNAKSKAEREISANNTSLSSVENVSLPFNNSYPLIIGHEWSRVAKLSFGMSKDQNLLFHGVCKMNLITKGTVRFKYISNNTELNFIHELQVPTGIHTATLFIPVKSESNQLNSFEVFIQSDDAIGSIEVLDFVGSISGTGLTTSEWTGLITLDDDVPDIPNLSSIVGGIEASPLFSLQIPDRHGFSEYADSIENVQKIVAINESNPSIVTTSGDYPFELEGEDYLSTVYLFTEDDQRIISNGGFIDG